MGSAESIHPKGADIPDIILVIQFGVPSSLEVWTQRAGQAGRSPGICARAILLVEESMFRLQKKKRKKLKMEDNGDSPYSESEPDVVEVEGDLSLSWKKVVDVTLRRWIETTGCRWDFSDKYFDNPVERQGESRLCLMKKKTNRLFRRASGGML